MGRADLFEQFAEGIIAGSGLVECFDSVLVG
jgi:hypothetical protein